MHNFIPDPAARLTPEFVDSLMHRYAERPETFAEAYSNVCDLAVRLLWTEKYGITPADPSNHTSDAARKIAGLFFHAAGVYEEDQDEPDEPQEPVAETVYTIYGNDDFAEMQTWTNDDEDSGYPGNEASWGAQYRRWKGEDVTALQRAVRAAGGGSHQGIGHKVTVYVNGEEYKGGKDYQG